MSQVNSGIGTKACTFDFSKNGALGLDGSGNPVFSFAGISFAPGESILDIRGTTGLMGNLVSGSGPTTTFSVGWGPTPYPGPYFTPFFRDTIGNINLYIFSLYQSPTINKRFSDNVSFRWPVFMSSSSNVYFTSSAALQSGRVSFIITYLYAKF